jgi:hypothetical protein
MGENLPSEKITLPKESTLGANHTLHHNGLEVDVYKLVHATQEIPVVVVPIEKYTDDLNDQCWTDDQGKRVSPNEVIEAYRIAGDAESAIAARPELSQHIRKIDTSDYSFPVLVFESKVIDGMHRLAKAVMERQTSIKVKLIGEMPEEVIISSHDAQ